MTPEDIKTGFENLCAGRRYRVMVYARFRAITATTPAHHEPFKTVFFKRRWMASLYAFKVSFLTRRGRCGFEYPLIDFVGTGIELWKLDFQSVPAPKGTMAIFQTDCEKWMQECFGDKIASDMTERAMRFLEEAMELAQAQGMTKDECGRVLEYVYNRPQGEINQEVGGVIVTLACFCAKAGIDLQKEALREFARIDTPEMRLKIFAKQQAKKDVGMTSETLRAGVAP